LNEKTLALQADMDQFKKDVEESSQQGVFIATKRQRTLEAEVEVLREQLEKEMDDKEKVEMGKRKLERELMQLEKQYAEENKRRSKVEENLQQLENEAKKTKEEFRSTQQKLNTETKVLSEKVSNLKDEIDKSKAKEGYMTKQGGRIKTWKERWFILKDCSLVYYKHAKDKEPLGRIEIDFDAGDNVVQPSTEKKFSFAVETRNRKYIMQAQNQDDLNGWLSAIRHNMKYAQKYRKSTDIRRKSQQNDNSDNEDD